MWLKVKYGTEVVIQEWGLIIVIFLATFSSFGLGRLSATETARPPVSVGKSEIESEPRGVAIGGLVVASRSGTAYHYPWCSGANQIKPENKIWFQSEEAAQAAGYAPSKSCKGLK